MRRSLAGGAGALLALTVAGCGYAGAPGDAGPSQTATPARVAFELYTHCGIHELTFEGRWYERVGGALDDGEANPPAGWDNPHQAGTLTVSGTTAVFSDSSGHRETFALRAGATAPKTICS